MTDDEPDAIEPPEQRDLEGQPVGQAKLPVDDEDDESDD